MLCTGSNPCVRDELLILAPLKCLGVVLKLANVIKIKKKWSIITHKSMKDQNNQNLIITKE